MKDRTISEVQKDLEKQRDSLLSQVKQIEQALAGVVLAHDLTNGKKVAGIGQMRNRSGEHLVPVALVKAAMDYVLDQDSRFGMKAIRHHLAGLGKFSENDLAVPLAATMRKLASENVVDVVVRGIGRREAIYERSK